MSKIHGQEFPRLILPLCSPCGERRGSLPPPPCMGSFNPRSPCGERPESEIRQVTPCSVSIHAPRVGSDIILCCNAKVARKFQSTLPVWGATPSLPNYATEHMFQSTLPVWGATARFGPDVNTAYVSIHAPRVGSDLHAQEPFTAKLSFNPRSPCGERLHEWSLITGLPGFQSTLPVWGATAKMHKILFLISEEYVDSAKRQAVGLNIKGNLPFIPSAF